MNTFWLFQIRPLSRILSFSFHSITPRDPTTHAKLSIDFMNLWRGETFAHRGGGVHHHTTNKQCSVGPRGGQLSSCRSAGRPLSKTYFQNHPPPSGCDLLRWLDEERLTLLCEKVPLGGTLTDVSRRGVFAPLFERKFQFTPFSGNHSLQVEGFH